VLRDRSATEVTRARAFLVVARRFEEIVANQQEDFDRAFAEFAAHREAHLLLRSQGDIAQLARSGQRLDELRTRMCAGY